MNLPTEGESHARGDSAGEPQVPRRPGDLHKTITMAQIAKAAGVSQGAISSLLNDRDYGIRVSEKTRERVFKVCREMGYVPNDLRAVVRMYPEFGDFCFLISNGVPGGLSHPMCARAVAGALAAVPDPAHPLTLAYYDESADYTHEPEALPAPVRSGIASKFLCFGQPNPSLCHALARRAHPLISLAHDMPIPGVLSILADYNQAAHLAIEHLATLGHKRIAIVSGPFGATDTPTLEINHGLRVACEEFGISIGSREIVYASSDRDWLPTAIDELLGRKAAPTAVFCMSDAFAAAVLAQATARGLKVPHDLSVVGCGGDYAEALATVGLTTVHLPVEDIGAAGVREMDRLIRDGAPTEAHKIVLPATLRIRQTTAAPRA
jgi:DNA-binding LacI/PurR family transcriptional regulator